MQIKIAAATTDGYTIDQHFGRADRFVIITADDETGEVLDEDERTVVPFCREGLHEETTLSRNLELLKDCRYILVSRIGPRARNEVERAGFEVYEIPGDLVQSVEKMLSYIRLQKFMEETFSDGK